MKAAPSFVVIMAGGQGTRFWPRSRRNVPKQFLPIAGGRTMLQDTARRMRRLCPASRTLVVTGAEHASLARRQLPELPAANVLAEPVGRNTAPCIGLAAAVIAGRVPEATMIVVPADHAITGLGAFAASMRRAVAIANENDCLVTIGVRPTRAETGYGYIEVGEPIRGAARARARWASTFHEKPDRRRAERYVASRRFLWNSGMFVWRTSVIQAALARHLPSVAEAVGSLCGLEGRRLAAALRGAYRGIESVSIDYGVMERAERVAVVVADFGWSDVGSWAAMPELWGTDGSGNAKRGQVLAIDSRGNVVFSPRRLVALVAADDLVVVDSRDALLVCRRDRAQDVRLVVEALQRSGRRRYL